MNRKIDCVCLSSNLGIYPSLANNLDSEGFLEAPGVIVENTFLHKIAARFPYTLQCATGLPEGHFILELARQLETCLKAISQHFCKENHHVYLGGDHSITFVSLTTSLRNYGTSLGYIQLDSHADMNQWQTSPSKNFHGMYMRPFLDTFDIPILNELVRQKIDPAQVLFIGNLDLDQEEEIFFKKNRIKNIRKEDYLSNPKETLSAIQLFVNQFDHLHVSFDIDIFHRDLISSVTCPSPDGWYEAQVFELLRAIFDHPHCSLDIVEYNPRYALKHKDHSSRLVKAVLDCFNTTRKYVSKPESTFSAYALSSISPAPFTKSYK